MTTHASTSFLEGTLNVAVGDIRNRHARRREKVFGDGKPRPMSRNVKLRIMALARLLLRATEPGKHYGRITAKHFAVLAALLWGFHNSITGRCFPSLEAIAEKAGCARSTVAEAIKALEDAGVLTWVHRIKRVCSTVEQTPGDAPRWRVERTSNGYQFTEPPDVKRCESELPSGTKDQDSFPSLATGGIPPNAVDPALDKALSRLGEAVRTGASRA